MARYFTIMSGLRGCYMPDSCIVIKCTTRRELKDAIAYELEFQTNMGEGNLKFDGGKKTIAWAAAKAWRESGMRKFGQYAVIPYGEGKERPFSVEIGAADRNEWLEYEGSHI